MIDAAPPPALWLPAKPAIIRQAGLLRPPFADRLRYAPASFLPGMFPGGAFMGGAHDVVSTFVNVASSSADSASRNFGTLDLGATSLGDYVVLCFTANGIASGTVSSFDVGGNAATELADVSGSGSSIAHIAIVSLPATQNANVTVTLSTSMARAGLSWFRVADLMSATAYATSIEATGGSGNIDAAAGGVLIGCTSTGAASNNRHSAASRHFAAAASSHAVSVTISSGNVAWTGLDEDSDVQPEAADATNAHLAVVSLR